MPETDLAALLLRLIIGTTIAAHGYNHIFGGGGISGTAQWFGGLGLEPRRWHAWTSGVLELLAGVGLVLGFLTPVWVASVVGIMAVAAVIAHRSNGFFVFKDGYEYVLVLAVAATALACLPPGRWSVDSLLNTAMFGPVVAILAAVVGLAGAALLLGIFWRPARSAA